MEYSHKKISLSPDSLVNKLRRAWKKAERRTRPMAMLLIGQDKYYRMSNIVNFEIANFETIPINWSNGVLE